MANNNADAYKEYGFQRLSDFVTNKNAELDEAINSQDVTLVDVKNAYLERIVGMG